ncbi:helix-turn-helix domain-containing protein [Ructibacterium gallinarum]|uniref:AraC family transcriptional regulator n=1 Tax=Ructibacterium gallinarum TaxID=2779355 RepID=A0A9D5M3K2_9FIRM|nr:helix-turn-helix domain-containing protein [Ructibacterium gallinarum]MBE5040049.1 AraC family transcriptional regulator [Ructibacterium gallinarum]
MKLLKQRHLKRTASKDAKMRKVPWNVRKKWILGFYVVLLVVIIFSIIFFSFDIKEENFAAEVRESQKGLLAQMSQNIDLRLEYIEKMITAAADRQETEQYFSNAAADENTIRQLSDTIGLLAESDKNIDSAYLYSIQNRTVVTESGVFGIDTFYDTKWMESVDQLQKKREVWTSARMVTNPSQPTSRAEVVSLVRTYPLITTPDKIQGYFVVNINTMLLNQIVQEALTGTESSFMIINLDNKVLFRSQNYFTYDEETVIHLLAEKTGSSTFFTAEDGQNMLMQDVTLPSTDWKLVSVMPYTDMVGTVRAFRGYNIFLGIAVSLFMILTFLLSSKWMYAPVDRFMHIVVKNAENGDDKKRLRDFDELGRVFLYAMEQQKDLRKQINGSIPFIKYQLVTELISGRATDYKKFETQLSMIKVNLYPENYIVMLIDLDDKDILDVKSHWEPYDVYMAGLYNKAEELANQEGQGFAVQLPNQMCFVLLSFETGNVQGNTLRALELAEYLNSFMQRCYGITITVAVGDHYQNFQDIVKSYKEADSLMKYKPIMGNNCIITVEDIKSHTEANVQKADPEVETLLRAFESLNQEKIHGLLDQVFQTMKAEKFPSDAIVQVCMRIVQGCMLIYSGQETELSNSHYQSIHLSLNQLDTVEEMEDFVQQLLDEMIQEMSEKKQVHGSEDLIDKIVKYVDRNYAEYNMSLNLLADTFGLSIPYLSKIFKAYTQKTFTDYLIEIRIKKAAELLVSTNKKVNEISEMVGYPNASSFIRIFKKYYFMTPIDYRNRHKYGGEG